MTIPPYAHVCTYGRMSTRGRPCGTISSSMRLKQFMMSMFCGQASHAGTTFDTLTRHLLPAVESHDEP